MERRIKIGMRIANEKMSNYTVIKESVTFGGKEMNPVLLFLSSSPRLVITDQTLFMLKVDNA